MNNKEEQNNEVEDEKSTEENEIIENRTFNDEIITFLDLISSLYETIDITLDAIEENLNKSIAQLQEFLNDNAEIKEIEGKTAITIDREEMRNYYNFRKRSKIYDLSFITIPRSYVISLICQFDAFLGRLLRVVFLIKPEILNSSEKSITLAQLTRFKSITDAKEYFLEKKIETILRQSHVDQFDWMEKKFNIELRKELTIWSTFVEVTERRNLFVHSGGIVSSQYLSVCNDNNVLLDDIKIGDELHVSREYFMTAYNTIYEIGFKLAQVFWRKFQPDELEKADANLIECGYNTLFDENYELAKMIFNFGILTLKKHSNEENRRIMIINRAQSYKWSGDDEAAKEIVLSEDWSASSDKFKLAKEIILDDFQEAYKIMKIIGDNDKEMRKEFYKEWPLFRIIRNENDFLNIFEEIYNEPYNRIPPEEIKEE